MTQESSAGDVRVLTPVGDIDLTSARELGSRLGELAGTSGDAVLDLSEVGFLDSVGLAVVLKAATRFHRQDKQLVIVAPDGSPVSRLLELSGMGGRLATVPTRDAALDAASTPR